MPTRAGWAVLLGSVAAVVGGRLLGLLELTAAGLTGIILCALALLLVRPAPLPQVERRIITPRVALGDPCRIELVVTNSGRRPSPVVDLHETIEGTPGAEISISPLAPGERRSAGYRLPTSRRGVLTIGPLEVRRTDPLGLAGRRRRVAGPSHALVLPRIEVLRRSSSAPRDPTGNSVTTGFDRAASGELATLLPYTPGDDLRRVHWASSARAGDLLVRRDHPLAHDRVTVIVDNGAPGRDGGREAVERFERMISAAAGILAAAPPTSELRLLTADGLDTGPLTGTGALDRVLDRLAVLEPRQSAARLGDLTRFGPHVLLRDEAGSDPVLSPPPGGALAIGRTGWDARSVVFEFCPSRPAPARAPRGGNPMVIPVPDDADFARVWGDARAWEAVR